MKLLTSCLVKIIRRYGTHPKYSIDLDKNVKDALETGSYKPKQHEGVIRCQVIKLPDHIVNNIKLFTQELSAKSLISEAQKLKQYLHSRHLPLENHEINRKIEDSSLFIERKLCLNTSNITEEERQNFRDKHKNEIQKAFNYKSYIWKSIDYDDFQAKVYLFAKSAANYAVLYKIFLEIKTRVSDFQPKTLLDFGSGVGTVTWAANAFWKDSLQEYFCVDSSSCMNDLAYLILKGKNDSTNKDLRGLFYRQFLPLSQSLQHDIVVSAFSLFELPDLKSRLTTILTLWRKAKHYLIIVEEGTNAGFQVINEARDFILEFSNDSKNGSDYAHVFAPCPHEKPCPRFTNDHTPCNFEVSYINPFAAKPFVSREKFSYVILRKGSRPSEDKQWPRIVREVLPRSRHVVCRICTGQGTLEEIIVTTSKHGKLPYKCARYSQWGDLLPITILKEESCKNEKNNPNCEDEVSKTDDEIS